MKWILLIIYQKKIRVTKKMPISLFKLILYTLYVIYKWYYLEFCAQGMLYNFVYFITLYSHKIICSLSLSLWLSLYPSIKIASSLTHQNKDEKKMEIKKKMCIENVFLGGIISQTIKNKMGFECILHSNT